MLETNIYEQARRYSSIIESSADGILLLDSIRDEQQNIVDFTISHCNKVGCQLGCLPQDALGKTLLQMLPHLAGGDQSVAANAMVKAEQAFERESLRLASLAAHEQAQSVAASRRAAAEFRLIRLLMPALVAASISPQ